MEDQFYKERILDYYRRPRNKRVLEDADLKGTEYNPLCGDNVCVFAQLSGRSIISAMTFTGEGCAISQAAASLFVEYAIGKQVHDIAKTDQSKMEELLGVPVSIARARCALLPIKAFCRALQEKQS